MCISRIEVILSMFLIMLLGLKSRVVLMRIIALNFHRENRVSCIMHPKIDQLRMNV